MEAEWVAVYRSPTKTTRWVPCWVLRLNGVDVGMVSRSFHGQWHWISLGVSGKSSTLKQAKQAVETHSNPTH